MNGKNKEKPAWQKYREDLESGMSCAEVARKYGVSRQAVWSATGKNQPAKFRELTKEQCIYPNLRLWFNENKITRAEFCRRLWGHTTPAFYKNYIYPYLTGKNDPPKKTIDKIIKVTGLPYEVLFAVDSDTEQESKQ